MALRSVYAGSTARILCAGVAAAFSFPIERATKQRCPSSASVWALVFDPAVRLLRQSMLGPHDDSSVFVDDIAGMVAEVFAHLPALLRVFDALWLAASLSLNDAKTSIVDYGYLSDFMLKCRLMDATRVAQIVVARRSRILTIDVRCFGPHRPRSGSG